MVAIYQSNPHAFVGNINVLRAGSTLRIPDAADDRGHSGLGGGGRGLAAVPPVARRHVGGRSLRTPPAVACAS